MSARRCVVGLGASLGDRHATLALAVRALHARFGVVSTSRVWESAPAGGVARRAFLNAAVLLLTDAEPLALLGVLKELERRLGRRPALRFADRVIDLDLLWVEGLVREADPLLPHPRLHERAFALGPLLEVAPDALDPRDGRPLADFRPPAPLARPVSALPSPRGALARARPAVTLAAPPLPGAWDEALHRHRQPRRDP